MTWTPATTVLRVCAPVVLGVGLLAACAQPPVSPTRCLSRAPITGHDYNTVVSGTVGPWQAGDSPHQYPLPDGRVLWLWNDSFLNATKPTGPVTPDSSFVRNAAWVEDGACFTVLNEADANDEYHDYIAPTDSANNWYWPMGGTVEGNRLFVFLVELRPLGPPTWALNYQPVSTWIATIDTSSLAVLDVEPAPDAGVGPMYGNAVVDDGAYTYLFGNSLLYNATASATYLARVPDASVTTGPLQYWTGSTWSPSRGAARPVIDPGGFSYVLAPQLIGTQWVALTKVDDFFGDRIDILGAPSPTGPWTVAGTTPAPPKAAAGQNTYTASALTGLRTGGQLIVEWSNNNSAFDPVSTNPGLYRPTFTDVTLPSLVLHNRTRSAANEPTPTLAQ